MLLIVLPSCICTLTWTLHTDTLKLQATYFHVNIGCFSNLLIFIRSGPDLRDSDGPKELLDSFREDMSDLELNIRQGQLGGVKNFEKWDKKLESATKLKDLVSMKLVDGAACYYGEIWRYIFEFWGKLFCFY